MSARSEISAFLAKLRSSDRFSQEQRDWTRYAFHFTDINNIPSIFEAHHLYPRDTLGAKGIEFFNAANAEILDHTPASVKERVRLYFRPRVPMLYVVEGFDSKAQIGSCPVPIYLLFDSVDILSMPGTLVSRGNCSKVAWQRENELLAPIRGLDLIPFDLVFHDDAYPREDAERIVFHRQAEVLVKDQLSLESLRWIFVRSPGELQTLRTLLNDRNPKLWNTFGSRVRVNTKAQLFNRHRLYVEQVRRIENDVFIQMNSQSMVRGPIDLEVRSDDGTTLSGFRNQRYEFDSLRLRYQLPVSSVERVVAFEVRLNDHVAFKANLDSRPLVSVFGRGT